MSNREQNEAARSLVRQNLGRLLENSVNPGPPISTYGTQTSSVDTFGVQTPRGMVGDMVEVQRIRALRQHERTVANSGDASDPPTFFVAPPDPPVEFVQADVPMEAESVGNQSEHSRLDNSPRGDMIAFDGDEYHCSICLHDMTEGEDAARL